MSKILNKDEIISVLKGAAFLGAGGGGSVDYGMEILNQLEVLGYDIELPLITIDEMDGTKYAGMVAGLGQPTAIDPVKLADDLPGAFRALQVACAADGNDLRYLYSGEMGGFNTMVAIFLSIVSSKDINERTPLIDADGNGRATPALYTCLTSARGIPPKPLGMAGHKTNEPQYRYISWPIDEQAAEDLARKLGGSWYDLIGFSTWAMSKEQLKANACDNYVSYAKRIGEALENTQMPLFDALHSVMPRIKEYFNGIISEINNDPDSGFDKGTIIIKDRTTGATRIGIKYQNESLYVGKYENGAFTDVSLTAPELISLVDSDTRKPLTNDNVADVFQGQNVTVFLSPAHYYWWDSKNAYESFRSILDDNGYTGAFVRFNPFFEANPLSRADNRGLYFQLAYAGVDQTLENDLNEYCNQNIYKEAGVYDESLITQGFFEQTAQDIKDPTRTETDIVLNGPPVLQLVNQPYVGDDSNKPWAGHLLSRFNDDKTVRALREATSRSIFDAFEPALLLSLALANKTTILTWPETMIPTIERRIAASTFGDRIASVRLVKEFPTDNLLNALVDASKQAIDEDGAQAILIGNSFYEGDGITRVDYNLPALLEQTLASQVGYAVPVIDPNRVGPRWIEMCAHMGYFHSRLSYYTPPKKIIDDKEL